MNFRMILGDQPNRNGTVSDGHQARLEAALSDSQPKDIILCTGGVTVEDIPPEAELALAYIKTSPVWSQIAVICESESKTTSQNFRHSLAHLEKECRSDTPLVIYCGKAQLPKVRVLVWWWLPTELRSGVQFVALPDHRGFGYKCAQITIGTVLALVDPYEKWVAKLTMNRTARATVLE